MMKLALIGVLVLVVGGCVCVVWASRGGPRWVRAVAAVTLELAKAVGKSNRRSTGSGNNGNNGDTGGDSGGS
ncbi:hypothetical protein ACH4M4_16245 [Streptomyces sp. NPDC017254]|uniref:hypothetical protein n=1 Tax=unclassified Streptomyces TaxID=2593676 RepID=UPI0037B3A4F6